MSVQIFEIDEEYIDYMCQFDKHIFHNKQAHQQNKRKFIGVLFKVGALDYFAPLSSFKPKHKTMDDRIYFMKIGTYCVINLSSMFPVHKESCHIVDIFNVEDEKYKQLLLTEARHIRTIEQKIVKNATTLYDLVTRQKNQGLIKICVDFKLLEQKALEYKK